MFRETELARETAPTLLTGVPMDPGLSTKPNIGKVKFFEVRKKKKQKREL